MNTPVYKLLELQGQLYALADQLEVEAAKPPPFPVNWQARNSHQGELNKIRAQYIESAFGIMINAYLLGSFGADPKWRTILAISRKMARGSKSWFDAILNNLRHRYGFRCQMRLWRRTNLKTEIAIFRLIASRMLLLPIDPSMQKNWRRYRKNLYRLPKEQRTVPSPYIEEIGANCAGEFKSMKDALKLSERVWRLNLSGGVSADDLMEIGRLSNLRILDISDNKLTALPNSLFQLNKLTRLDARNNELSELSPNVEALVNLQYLNLNGNRLTSLPTNMGNLSHLRELWLGSNKLNMLPESIGNLIQLNRLSLDSNRLETLPENLSGLIALESLFLDHNQLSVLPDSIGNLTQLRRVYLRGNKLTELPETSGNLRELKSLNLAGNQLISLPECIGNLTKLTRLGVTNLRLRTLPKGIGNLINLVTLDLRSNPLTVLPDSIGNMTKLSQLMFANCLLS